MHRGIGSIQGPSGLGQSEQTWCRDGRVPIVSIREDCVEPGLISLLHEAVLEAVYLLYPIAAVFESLTMSVRQDFWIYKIRLNSHPPFQF